jgi:hypothetical protein
LKNTGVRIKPLHQRSHSLETGRPIDEG